MPHDIYAIYAFSHMRIIKSKYCSTITDHLEACLRLASSSYSPDYATLADSIQWKSSEYALSLYK